ncbi:MAG: cytochrome c, partial [Chloroflexota bacterium]|nr:cytochrome c [Chloroflexota bacterium]
LYSLTPQLLLGIVGLALAVLAFAMRQRRPRRARRPLAATGAALALTGLLASVTALAGGYRESVASAMPVVNPISPTSESLALGGQLYAQNCLVCHGATGRGDGPAGRALRPPPADFRVHMAAGHTDEQLFEWISKGVVGTAMQAFADRLTADERWHLVNYIRTFADPGTPSTP